MIEALQKLSFDLLGNINNNVNDLKSTANRTESNTIDLIAGQQTANNMVIVAGFKYVLIVLVVISCINFQVETSFSPVCIFHFIWSHYCIVYVAQARDEEIWQLVYNYVHGGMTDD